MQSKIELNQPHDEPTENRQVRTLVQKSFKAALAHNGILISPAAPSAAYKIGEKKNDPLSMYAGDIMTVNVNLAGLPALELPCEFLEGGPAGLPVGLQMIGSAFDEEMLLKVGHVFKSFPSNYGRMVCSNLALAILVGFVCLPCVSGKINMTVNAIDKKVESFLAVVQAMRRLCSWDGLLRLAAFLVCMIALYNFAIILKAVSVQVAKCLPRKICKDPEASTGEQANVGNVNVGPGAGTDNRNFGPGAGADNGNVGPGARATGGQNGGNVDVVLASGRKSDLEAGGSS